MKTVTINGIKYLTPEQVLERMHPEIRVSRGTLDNWRADRKNPKGPTPVKICGKVFYPLENVITWEKQLGSKSARKRSLKVAG